MSAEDFPCALTIDIALPTHRLASSALRALQVDAELSPLVRRTFCLASPSPSVQNGVSSDEDNPVHADVKHDEDPQGLNDTNNTILRTEYRATTNRMLRVAVNGFMESLGVVLQVMEELDVDVLKPLLPE